MKRIYLLIDTELELAEGKSCLEDLKSFLNFFYNAVLTYGIKNDYNNTECKFFCYGNHAAEMISFLENKSAERNNSKIKLTYEKLSVTKLKEAYKKVVDYSARCNSDDSSYAVDAFFIVAFRHTNKLKLVSNGNFNLWGNKQTISSSSKIVIGINKSEKFFNDESLLEDDSLTCCYYSTKNQADNSQVSEIIKRVFVPYDGNITSCVKKDPALSVKASEVASLSETVNCEQINDINGKKIEEAYVNTASKEIVALNHKKIDLLRCAYAERLDYAIQTLEAISSSDCEKDWIGKDSNMQISLKKLPFMYAFDVNEIPGFIKDNINYFIAYLVFYIMSGGECPQNLWKDLFEDYKKSSIGELESFKNEVNNDISKLCGKKVASEVEEIFDEISCDRKRTYIQMVVKDLEGVGCVKIFELLFLVFTKRYEYFDVHFWLKTLQGFQSKRFKGQLLSEKCEQAELFAVSYKGQLEKPGKIECEDYSLIKKYNNYTWLAVVSDGVGGCVNSSVGSEKAASCLSDCISDYLRDHTQSHVEFTDEEIIAGLMYYLKFNLVNDFYNKWEKKIKSSPNYKESEKSDISNYSATLQFAFGCAKFIACGVLGDGSFYLKRKCDATGSNGGFILNDGSSGVMRSQVLTVANLKNEPKALQITFFDGDDISDILISSDGITNAVGKSVRKLDAFCSEMSVLPFDKRNEALGKLAKKCSDYNETNYGSGDDSSIAYIHIN